MSSITCQFAGKLVDMSTCSECFYKRLPEDISNIWCRYPIYKHKKESRLKNIEIKRKEFEKLKYKQEMLFRTGRPTEAEKLQIEIEEVKEKLKMSELTNKAIAHLTDEAMAIGNVVITRIEEYLTNKCTNDAVAERILDDEKSLETLYKKIKEKAKETASDGVAVLEDSEVYKMVDEYYELEDMKEKPKAVNILDLL